jgi:CRISPR system Cascade subunit CasE
MHLTRFEINAARRGARRLLSSPQNVHAAVLSAFRAGAAEPSEVGRVLWRVDAVGSATHLYLVSPGKPDLTHLVEDAGWPSTQGWVTKDYDTLLERLAEGDRWVFRLRANPTRSGRKTSESPATQRFGHLTVAQQLAWLTARADAAGFEIPVGQLDQLQAAVVHREVIRFERRGAQVTLATATYEGALVVRDPVALRRTLTHGLGPAKGYGCGLLTLARAV